MKDIRCFKQGCKERRLYAYTDLNDREIVSCQYHKPIGWRRLSKLLRLEDV